MKQNKLSDIYNGENGIFSIFADSFATEYVLYFGTTATETLDNYVLLNFGDRLLNAKITAENCVNFLVSIIAMYLPIWNKLAATLALSYNAATPINETRTKTGTLQRYGSNSETNTTAEKVFNDTDFVSDNQNTTSGTNNNTDTYNLTETLAASDSEVTKRVATEYDFRKNNSLQFEIVNNIINAIALKIY